MNRTVHLSEPEIGTNFPNRIEPLPCWTCFHWTIFSELNPMNFMRSTSCSQKKHMRKTEEKDSFQWISPYFPWEKSWKTPPNQRFPPYDARLQTRPQHVFTKLRHHLNRWISDPWFVYFMAYHWQINGESCLMIYSWFIIHDYWKYWCYLINKPVICSYVLNKYAWFTKFMSRNTIHKPDRFVDNFLPGILEKTCHQGHW